MGSIRNSPEFKRACCECTVFLQVPKRKHVSGSIERPGKTQAKGVQHTNAAYFYKQAAP